MQWLIKQEPFPKYLVVYFSGAGGKDAKIVHEIGRKKEHVGDETKEREDKSTTDAEKKKKEKPDKAEKVKRNVICCT